MPTNYQIFEWTQLLQHAFHDGRLEEVVIRHVGGDDGDTVIAKDIRSLFPTMILGIG